MCQGEGGGGLSHTGTEFIAGKKIMAVVKDVIHPRGIVKRNFSLCVFSVCVHILYNWYFLQAFNFQMCVHIRVVGCECVCVSRFVCVCMFVWGCASLI